MITSIEELDSFFNSYNPSMGNGKLRENRLQRMELLLNYLGSPEKEFESIHIAGSKGKGTTAAYLSRIISKSGKKCGLYMSPHVYDIRERFTDSLTFFDDALYLDSANELIERIESFELDEEYGLKKPTTFELYTAYAYLLFKNAGCEYAVIETGLGGRLDATNTLDPLASVITSIELEHTNVLGSTKEEIAGEKAGIIKRDRPVFTGGNLNGTLQIVETKARKLNAPVYPFYCDTLSEIPIESSIKINGKPYSIKLDTLSEIKRYDALFALYIASELGIANTEELDLSSVDIPARYERYEVYSSNKTIDFIFDGAHTEASAMITMNTIIKDIGLDEGTLPDNEATLIFSAAEGKNVDAIGKILFPYFKNIIITSCGSFKKSYPDVIYGDAIKIVPEHNVSLIENTEKATAEALRITEDKGHVFVIGSFYLCSEIKNALKEFGL